MHEVRKLSEFILYSKLWVAGCAASQCIYTFDLLRGFDVPGPYVFFVFGSTLFLYTFHQLISLRRSERSGAEPRRRKIAGYTPYLFLYGLLGAGIGVYFFLQMGMERKLWLVFPAAVIALGYMLPLFGQGRRLRDLPWIKIFLVAITWSWAVVIIPLLSMGKGGITFLLLAGLERTFLFLAVTIPSDIRDREFDASHGLTTIATKLGVRKSRQLSLIMLLCSGLLNFVLIVSGFYPVDLILPFLLFSAIAAYLLYRVDEKLDDLFYSGLVDGCVFLLPLMYWLFHPGG